MNTKQSVSSTGKYRENKSNSINDTLYPTGDVAFIIYDSVNKQIDDKMHLVNKNFRDLKKELSILKEENRKNIFKSVEIIGIFSALLSFIVFESQVFKSIQSGLVLVGLSLTMLGALTFFVLTLDLVCDGLSKLKRLRISLLSLSVIFVFVGYLAANNGYKNSDFTVYVKNDEIDQRIKDQINSVNFNSAIQYDIKFMEFKNCILKRGLAQCL